MSWGSEMSETFTHRPVLLDECIQGLNIRPEGIYLDGTLGRAGHSREIARRLTTGRLICVDRDQAALDAAQDRLADWMDRVTLVHSNFDQVAGILDDLGIAGADGMLFDLGVSSPQLDDGSRGFSYMADAPLDMRMDRSEGLTAADIVIHYDPWWNVAVENQATDRAHRIGQKNVVTVYKLIAKGTIEEKIIKLQQMKKELAEEILSGDEIKTASFQREELLELLEERF